jgi:hypothetical protein
MDVESYAAQSAFELVESQFPRGQEPDHRPGRHRGERHERHDPAQRPAGLCARAGLRRQPADPGHHAAVRHEPGRGRNRKRTGNLPENFESDLLRPFLDNLALEVSRALQFFFTSTQYNQVDHIVLAGGCAVIPGVPMRRVGSGPRSAPSSPIPLPTWPVPAHPAEKPGDGRPLAACRLRPGPAEVRSVIRINLLPHREEKRKAGASSSTCCSVWCGAGRRHLVPGFSDHQSARSRGRSQERVPQAEIASLDKEIAEIKGLQEQTNALLSRKRVIESLQANRTETVHLFNDAHPDPGR